MPANLWSQNSPQNFWQCKPVFSDDLWNEAIGLAIPILELKHPPPDLDSLLELILGEAQFGLGHWTLSRIKRIYYSLKPLLPRSLTRFLRQMLHQRHRRDFELDWPIEARYPRFQFDILNNLIQLSGQSSVEIRALWPEGKRFSFVLTHDIESAEGQQFAEHVAELEEGFGFRSSFNFVPADYRVNLELVNKLRQRGFEIGIHGLKHDGKLFDSRKKFMQCADQINVYLKQYCAAGFRSPLTHRHPEWMQVLDIEYDLSFFDTDPFEPIPGGTMSIWPFFLGHFVELPYTLVQDYTLTSILNENSPTIWQEKVDFIENYHGMALLNSHPDYLMNPANLRVYSTFLSNMRARGGYWHALPYKIAQWWRNRSCAESHYEREYSVVTFENGDLKIKACSG